MFYNLADTFINSTVDTDLIYSFSGILHNNTKDKPLKHAAR